MFKFFKKKKESVPALVSSKPKFFGRTEYRYKAKCVLTFNEKPVRTFDSTVRGFSRKDAAKRINEGYDVKVQSIHRLKG